MRLISSTSIGVSGAMSIASSRARSPPSCQCNNRQNMSVSLISRQALDITVPPTLLALKALGLTIPRSLLERADEVIE